MSPVVVLVGAVAAEIVTLFSFWTWARVSRSPRWLLTGSVAAAIFGSLAMAIPHGEDALLLFLGIYVCAGLLWTWIVERSPPRTWHIGERAIAMLGIVLCASFLLF